jgi:hypothetical protein
MELIVIIRNNRLKVGVGAALAILVLWFGFSYRPRRDEASALDTRREALARERDQLAGAIAEERAKAAEPATEARPARVAPASAAKLSPVERLNFFLESITEPANDLDLAYFAVTPLPPIPGPGYEELPFTVSLAGRYAALTDFLYQLEYGRDFIVRNPSLRGGESGVQADFQLAALLPTGDSRSTSSTPAEDPGRPTSLELSRDPFIRPPAKLAVGPDGRSYFLNVPAGLTLSGTMQSGRRKVAIINHEPYAVGDTIDYKQITRIDEQGVELSDKVRTYFLEMERPAVQMGTKEAKR